MLHGRKAFAMSFPATSNTDSSRQLHGGPTLQSHVNVDDTNTKDLKQTSEVQSVWQSQHVVLSFLMSFARSLGSS